MASFFLGKFKKLKEEANDIISDCKGNKEQYQANIM